MRLFLSFTCALLLAILPRIALAQMVQINPTLKMSLPRLDASGNAVQKRDPSLNPEGINLQDCRDNLQIQVPLLLSGFLAGDVVEVWASDSGGDCSVAINRTGSVAVCYKINAVIPLNTNPTVNLSVKEIIHGLPTANNPTDSNGCRLTQAPTPIDVQFLFLRGGGGAMALSKDDASFTTKTVGPPPLTGIRVTPGNTNVTISWDQIGEGGVTDILGVQAYCDPSPVQQVTTSQPTTQTVCDSGTYIDDGGNDSGLDAGTVVTFDAGCTDVTTGGGSSSSGAIPFPSPGVSSDGVACADSLLLGDGGATATVTDEAGVTTSGYIPGRELDKYKCGSAFGPTASTIIAKDIAGTPITNGKTIAVAIAGTDSYNNLGQLTSPLCQFAEQTTDFWNEYKNAGGGAGGCAMTGDSSRPAGTLAASAVALTLGISALKRALGKRRRRR